MLKRYVLQNCSAGALGSLMLLSGVEHPRQIRVENAGPGSIGSLYTRRTGRTGWGRDCLGGRLGPGSVRSILLGWLARPFDLRAVYLDGHEECLFGIDPMTTSISMTY